MRMKMEKVFHFLYIFIVCAEWMREKGLRIEEKILND
jgi:hypothetical protein